MTAVSPWKRSTVSGIARLSPAVMLDGKLYGRVSSEVADFLIDDAKRHA